MSAQIYKKKKVRAIISRSMVLLGIVFLMSAMFTLQSSLNVPTASAVGNLTPGRSEALVNGVFPPNNITGWNPLECVAKGGATSDSCFKIDSSVDAQSFWYAEGCLDNGTCTSGIYASTAFTNGHNDFLLGDTETDDAFGGMQYIYAENYDIEFGGYDGWIAKFTPNGGNSTQKYYWIVLPDQAYSNGFGETFVATFENLDEPVYFIVYDTHACPHQSEDYCGKAESDPDGVQAGREFLGAFTKNGGGYTDIANIVGKLTSLCRINGMGEVTVSNDASNANATTRSSSSSSSDSVSSDATWSDGWITGGLSGYVKEPAVGSSYPLGDSAHNGQYSTGGPNKITLHSTDGGPGDGNSGLALYGNDGSGIYPAHFTINLKDKKIFQHLPISQPSDAVKSHDEAAGIQIEIIGFSDSHTDDPYYLLDENNFSDDDWAYLGELLNAISAETGIPLTTSVDWENPSRLSSGDFASYEGILGHMHVPDNDHSDPGNIWPMVQKAIGGGCTTYEGDYPEYLQADEPWGSMDYGGCTYAACACGATSMAMLATYVTGQDVFPNDVGDLLGGSYYWATGGAGASELDKRVCEKYGCTAEAVSWSGYDDAISKMKQYLSEGYSIHLSGAGSYPFSDGGHYIGIFAPTSGDNVMTANSAFGGNAEMNLSDLVHAGLHYEFTIIKGSGGSGGSCEEYCDVESAVSVDGGLSEEQAQKIADYYNSDAVSSAGLPMGTKENCVSFSAWFVSYLTNVAPGTTNPTSGDGLDVAGNLVSDYGISGGDTPQVYSVFSNPSGTPVNGSSNHTGVIVGIENGEAITIEAAWGGWAGSDNGLARVWRYPMPESGMYYAYLSDRLDSSRLSEIIGGS